MNILFCLKIGDIIVLSEKLWKICQSFFTKGRKKEKKKKEIAEKYTFPLLSPPVLTCSCHCMQLLTENMESGEGERGRELPYLYLQKWKDIMARFHWKFQVWLIL